MKDWIREISDCLLRHNMYYPNAKITIEFTELMNDYISEKFGGDGEKLMTFYGYPVKINNEVDDYAIVVDQEPDSKLEVKKWTWLI